eukprot:scaffold3327_cov242-Pinguiococcus_pyrenoidosus.AAC.5
MIVDSAAPLRLISFQFAGLGRLTGSSSLTGLLHGKEVEGEVPGESLRRHLRLCRLLRVPVVSFHQLVFRAQPDLGREA